MTPVLRVALAQINVTVGAIRENTARIGSYLGKARRAGADLVLFPELALTGYPPEDLLFKSSFIADNLKAMRRLARVGRGLTAVIGFSDRDPAGNLYNAAAVLGGGRVLGRYHKMRLPNYGVFDEKRYFTAGARSAVLELGRGGGRVGLSICEDIWAKDSPCDLQAAAGASMLANISASPYHAGKRGEREQVLIHRAKKDRCWVCYVNLLGGQDELVFDGGSLAVSPSGRVVFRAPQFQEGLYVVEIPLASPSARASARGAAGGVVSVIPIPSGGRKRGRRGRVSRSAGVLKPEQEIFQALLLGLRDYVRKNGFSHVVLGMSGGIDSAFTAAIAVAALGRGAVTAVSMPSRYSSVGTRSDARRVAAALGIRFLEIPIKRMFQASVSSLEQAMERKPEGVTAENLQARIRGLMLMALSNAYGWLVLATGNKSELSTGYCTLYGDMVGGFAVIKDVPKNWVYRLSRTVNRFFGRAVIPNSVFTRPPSAELRPHQTDQDTLPPYAELDLIVRKYVEERLPAAEIRRRWPRVRSQVSRVVRMIDLNEYKRRQAPPGIKITPLAFGKDRRMPITNQYRETR